MWKVYGDRPRDYLAQFKTTLPADDSGQSDAAFAAIGEAGYIAAVRDVSFQVPAEEMLVVMGLSGSGKSTLLRCLSRLVEITAGRVMVEGRDLSTLDEKEMIALRRSKMGMVFQNFALLPMRTVLQNVAFPLEMRGQDAATCRQRALDMIDLVGLRGREDYFPRELSGGQQQRVGIARSLAIEPDIWFLDEPFSALDPLIRREMQDEFLRLQGMLGKTIVFITHDFDEALRLADRIAIMKDGVVCQIDRPYNIVLHPATDYVAQFTADIDKARVVRAGDIATAAPDGETKIEGEPLLASAPLRDLTRQMVYDTRESIPVVDADGAAAGTLARRDALAILFDEKV